MNYNNVSNVSLNEKLVSFQFSLEILFAVLLFIPAYNANAKVLPSFDCVKATTEVEKLICSDDELATLDLEMNKSYHAFMKTLDEKYYREKLKRKQIDWLGYRGKLSCFNTDNSKKAPCLKNAYQRRIENINAWASRKNYNFFIDYPDYYEQSKRIGYRKDMGKFISQLGEEYYIQCKKDIIIPKLPEEKVYFDDFPGPLPYMNSYIEINHTEENFIYFRCSEIQEIKEDKSLTEFSMNMINHTYGNLKIYPKDEDDKDDIIKFIKEEAIQNNNIEIIKLIKNNKALSSEECMGLWEQLKSNDFEIVPYISANSPFELKEKANISCTREQFYKIAKNKYGSYKRYVPPFRVYTIGEKTYLLGGTDIGINNICQIDKKKCHCGEDASTVNFQEGILLKIQKQFYFVKYSTFMSRTLSLTQLSDDALNEEYLMTSCMFKFTDKKEKQAN